MCRRRMHTLERGGGRFLSVVDCLTLVAERADRRAIFLFAIEIGSGEIEATCSRSSQISDQVLDDLVQLLYAP